ncbi:hypothetical protein LCGC14_1028230 [marine sediment metagenome]|uniref:Right handed beta helix domain-containing protein n=1 Tax=marine sediment metagenome TaxID=412755 RepID=A0A0F9QDJ5_9ZZZZ
MKKRIDPIDCMLIGVMVICGVVGGAALVGCVSDVVALTADSPTWGENEIIYNDRTAADHNAEVLSRLLSAGEHVTVMGGTVWIGGPGIIVGRNQWSVSFDLRGNGSHYYGRYHSRPGHGPTVFRPANDTMKAMLTIGGPDSDGHRAGRQWRVSGIAFYQSENYKRYTTNAHAIAACQADSFLVEDCSFRNFNVGVRLSPMAGSRMVSGTIRDSQFQRNRIGVLADGNGDDDTAHPTHCCLKIDTCNSVHDLTGYHWRDWWNGGTIANSTVHVSRNACVLIERSTVTMTGNYLEAGGERGKSTLKIRDHSRVSSTGLIAMYLDIDEGSTFVGNPPNRVDHAPGYALPAVYGDTESPSDPRESPGGYTAFPGAILVSDGVVWRCVEGGWGSGHRGTVWEPVGVMP